MNKYFKELILLVLIALPYAYLATIWENLPEEVPTHFDLQGNVNDWSNKRTLLYLPGLLGTGIYFLMIIIPVLDPKKKIKEMGSKYYNLRFILTFFISLLTTFILYTSKMGGVTNPNLLIALIAAMFAVLGNYFQAIRPNYFIGLRTPWTLESEEVWKKTHLLAGRIWMVGGTVAFVLSFVIGNFKGLSFVLGALLLIMIIVPVVFSYSIYQKEKNLKA
jgi:uncharacterized membrane protein